MDPVTVISIVSGVITLVDFSKEAIAVCQQVIDHGSTTKQIALGDLADSLDSAVTDLHDSLDDYSFEVLADDKVLIDLCRKCEDTTSAIRRQLVKLKRDANGGVVDIIKKTIHSMRKSGFLEQKRKELEDYERVLNTRILFRLDRKATQQSQLFENVLDRLNKLSLDFSEQSWSQQRQQDRARAYDRLMQSLLFPEISSRQEQIPDAYRHTYEWIFQDDGWENDAHSDTPHQWANFAQWLRTEGPNAVYWIHGKAGSGYASSSDGWNEQDTGSLKRSLAIRSSTLMSFVHQDPRTGDILTKWAGPNSTLLTPSFFFWESGTPMQKSVQGLLQSLLYQLVGAFRETLDPTEIAPRGIIYAKDGIEGPSSDSLHVWTQRQLTIALSKVLDAVKNADARLCFFIDGLDEFCGDVDVLRDIITTLGNYDYTKVCVSSRPEPAFIRFFAKFPQLRLQDLTCKDIASYVYGRLSRDLPDLKAPEAQNLVQDIVSKASGVFLWVRVIVQNIASGLRNGDTLSELQRYLNDVPQGLEELYSHMLAKMPKHYVAETQSYFEMLFADQMRPEPVGLTLLDFAAATDEAWSRVILGDKEYFHNAAFVDLCAKLMPRLISRCGGFVEVDEPFTRADTRLQRYLRLDYYQRKRGSLLYSMLESPIGMYFRQARLIHKSVLQFLKTREDSVLSLSEHRGKLRLARADISRAEVLSNVISQTDSDEYVDIRGYAFGMIANLVSLDNDTTFAVSTDKSMADDIDELVHLAYATLDALDKKLNPTQPGRWIQGPRISLSSLFIFRELQDRKARQTFHDEMGFKAFWGLGQSIQTAALTKGSSADWEYLLACSVSGLAICVDDFSIRKLLRIVFLSLSHGASLQRKITVREWLFLNDEYEAPFYASLSHSAALLSKTWHMDDHQEFFNTISFIISRISATNDHLLRFANIWREDMDELENLSDFTAARDSVLRYDLLVCEVSWLAFFEEICETTHDSKNIGAAPEHIACARYFRDQLTKAGAISSKRVSMYVASYPKSKVYRLDDEQSSQLTGLDCLHLFNAGQPEPGYGGWFAPPLHWESRKPEYNFNNWDAERMKVIFDNVVRVKGSLREEQVIGIFGSEEFVFGDESTYFNGNAGHSRRGSI